MNKRTLTLIIGIPAAIIILLAIVAVAATFRTVSVSNVFPSDESSVSMRPPMDVGESAPAFGGDYFADMDAKTIYPMPPEEPRAGETAADVEQRIIKNGYLDMVVDAVAETVEKITTLSIGKGGFVQDSSVTERADGTHYGSVTIRVPVAEFETTLSDIKTFANVVKTESTGGTDVTEQYSDLEAQLRNAQAQETEYLDILARANTVEEILMVQPYLNQARSNIESLQGRIQYLENLTAYSTISVSLSEEPTVRVPTKAFRPGTIANEAVQALIVLGQNLLTAIIWFAIVGLGILVPAVIVIWILVLIAKKFLDRWLK